MNRWLRYGRTIGLLTLLLMLPSGCSSATLRERVQSLWVRPFAVQTSTPPADSTNRILLQGADGNLYIASPDGNERFALTDDASRRRVYGQPSWSPDGDRIAWNEQTRDRSALVTSRYDGSERASLDVPFLPFYIYWSPTGRHLAYLSNWRLVDEPSMALRLVDIVDDDQTVKTLAAGQPFYFSWSPDGSRLLAHIDGERVEVYDVITEGGGAQSLVISGGAFSAPQWSATGDQLVYAIADNQTQLLLVTDLAGQPLQTLTDYDGRISFLLSPDGNHLAYVATGAEVAASTLGPLYVVDVETRRTRELSDRPVLAFYWSPDSQKLAFLTLDTINKSIGMRWNVWDGKATRQYSTFFPSRELLQNYLPFFDQYAQSHRIWSPESDAFVFAGTLANGENGVWVQAIGEEATSPRSLGPGVLATWSPQ